MSFCYEVRQDQCIAYMADAKAGLSVLYVNTVALA